MLNDISQLRQRKEGRLVPVRKAARVLVKGVTGQSDETQVAKTANRSRKSSVKVVPKIDVTTSSIHTSTGAACALSSRPVVLRQHELARRGQ